MKKQFKSVLEEKKVGLEGGGNKLGRLPGSSREMTGFVVMNGKGPKILKQFDETPDKNTRGAAPEVEGPVQEYPFNDGFTLIELLVFVLIIGILAAVALPQYQVAVAKARYASMISAVHVITLTQESYFLANGKYADFANQLDISDINGCSASFDMITCPDFHIDVYCVGCLGGTVQGHLDNGANLQLFEGLLHAGDIPGERECLAAKTDAVANKVCRSVSNSAEITEYTSDVAYNRYKI